MFENVCKRYINIRLLFESMVQNALKEQGYTKDYRRHMIYSGQGSLIFLKAKNDGTNYVGKIFYRQFERKKEQEAFGKVHVALGLPALI